MFAVRFLGLKTVKKSFFLLSLLIFSASVFAEPLTITGSLPVNPSLLSYYYVDDSNALTINEISEQADATWRKVTQQTPSFGYSSSAHWFRMSLTHERRGLKDYILAITYPILDHIEAYIFEGEKLQQKYTMGDTLDFQNRPLNNTNFTVPFSLNNNQNLTIYLRIKTESSVQVPLSLWDREDYLIDQQQSFLLQGVYFGIMLVMAAYNLFILVSTRYGAYLFYVISVLGISLFVATIRGFGFQFIWPDMPAINAWALPVSLCLFGSSALAFSIATLQLRKNSRFFFYALFVCAVIYLPMYFVSFYAPYKFSISVLIPLGILSCLLGFAAGIKVWVRGYRPARYYVLAYTSLIVGSLVISLNKLGYLPSNLFTENALILGSVLDVVLLSFALADRINTEKAERRAAEKQLSDVEMVRVREQYEQKEKDIKAEAAISARDDFISTMSHEIRTPMNGMMGVMQLLGGTNLDNDQKEYLDIMNGSSQTLLHILNDILDFSKIESGKMVIEHIPFNLHQLLHELVGLYNVRIRLKSHLELDFQIAHDVPKWVGGDPTRLRQIITNYLNNALKFTKAGRITLRVEPKDGQIEFSVEDSGIGISEEDQKKLFKKFSQAGSDTARKFGGSGLGLNICKSLAEMMGGAVGASSAEGKGSVFWARLPLTEASAYIERETEIDYDFSALKVLVVDDNSVNRFIAKRMLSNMGVTDVITAENGLEAIAKMKRESPDVILMDGQMPELDGYDAAMKIRQYEAEQGQKHRTFIIAFTGLDPFTTWVIVMQVWAIVLPIRKLKGVIYGGSQNKTN